MKAIQTKEYIDNKFKTVSGSVSSQFPSYIRAEHPGIINFVEHYYKWMEETGNVLNQIYTLPDILDIDKTPEEFVYYFVTEVMPTIPQNILINKRLLIKHIKDLYMTKGTESALRFLFRIMFNEDIEIYYPSDVILRCSDGIWTKVAYFKTTSSTNINILGRKVYGLESGSIATIDKVTPNDIDSLLIDVIELSNITGSFLVGETIETRDNLEYYRNILSGQIRSVTIKTKGSGYYIGEEITVPTIAFELAKIYVSEIDDNGGILDVSFTNNGFGYVSSSTENNINGKGASILYNVGAIVYDTGSFTTERGKLSGACVLQDGYKYQEFSYVIKSTQSLDKYKTLLYDTTHPAGMLLLGEVVIDSSNIKHTINTGNTEFGLTLDNISLLNNINVSNYEMDIV